MLTLSLLQTCIASGELMEARNGLVRYGAIVSDESSEHDGNFYRYTVFSFSGCTFDVLMKNGNVLSIMG